ncbi:MAG: homoserine kinase [Phascolarctobacterium sp.]|nr:homoserine kinase [Phascolarctobacterium sp.]
MEKISLRVPATSANCGPGFDTLGLACSLYNDFSYEITANRELELKVTGEGSEFLKPSGRNLAFAAFFTVWNFATREKRIGLKVTMNNRIPLSRGLGSSSSAIVAGVYAANALCGGKFSAEELLNFAAEIEGHPDNVAPALYGGFTVSFTDRNGKAHSVRFLPAKPLKFIAVVPEKRLSTSLARQVIPETVPHKDAVFNASRTAMLIWSLLTGRYEFLTDALEDKLHQPYRAHLISGLSDVLAAAKMAGAYNAIISGAGSTVMAYAPLDSDHEKIAIAMLQAFASHNEPCTYHILDLDNEGVKRI